MENCSQKNTLKFKVETYFLLFSHSIPLLFFPLCIFLCMYSTYIPRETTFMATFSSQEAKSNQKWHIVVTLIKLQIISDQSSPLEC